MTKTMEFIFERDCDEFEKECREFAKWETGQYDYLRGNYPKVQKDWEEQGQIDLLEKEDSKRVTRQNWKRQKYLGEEQRKKYIDFYIEARKYENTNVCSFTDDKRRLLRDYFPMRFIEEQPIKNYEPAKLGSLFKKFLEYPRKIYKESCKQAQTETQR